jgi:glycosyltransferase involved in cell wall biosynthesis
MRMSHSVVFYTDREVEECQLRMGRFAPARLSGLNNGINTDPVEACRSAYTASARKPHLLFIGRMTEKAQTRLLLMALADPRLSDIRLEIIGAGPEEASLRVQASELGIAARVVWHGPITEEATIASVANRCALFVYPGSVGLSLIHGMAYGLPAVVHSNRWHHMPEISALKPGVNGLTFEEGNAVSLAETIADALSDPIRLDRMSRESLETVRDSFNTKDMSKRFVAAVKEFTNVAA